MNARRTDLALEAHALFRAAQRDDAIDGLTLTERTRRGCAVTTVTVEGEAASRALGKPRGTYVTLDLRALSPEDPAYTERAALALRDELRALIKSLMNQMRSIFLDRFTQIAGNFAVVFRELFGGGEGKLTLTDTDNVLESGIEITVQPPGKIINNLASLSGGEQTFVAIAIYFAILKVRPAPFCILDEIEAALDEANVDRYADYLLRLTENTQFIAITHRRGTMEHADRLYGVTMQEDGVSKLLELALSDVDKIEK